MHQSAEQAIQGPLDGLTILAEVVLGYKPVSLRPLLQMGLQIVMIGNVFHERAVAGTCLPADLEDVMGWLVRPKPFPKFCPIEPLSTTQANFVLELSVFVLLSLGLILFKDSPESPRMGFPNLSSRLCSCGKYSVSEHIRRTFTFSRSACQFLITTGILSLSRMCVCPT